MDIDIAEGHLTCHRQCIIIIRATQKKMMSKPETRVEVGK